MGDVCQIAKLPVELLEIIFDDLIVATYQSPIDLCTVCSQWRTIISQRPRYWRTLVLRSTTTGPKMEQRLKLAGGEVRRLFVYGMERGRFVRLTPALKPALENIEEVHFEASRQHFSHVGNAEVLKCSPRILTLRGVPDTNHTACVLLGIPMMSHKLRELYISSFNPVWIVFLGLTPFLEVLHISNGGLPPHCVLTKMLIGLPRLENLFLEGAIAPNIWTFPLNFGLPHPLPAVLPSVKKLEIRLAPRVSREIVYWPRSPARSHQLQYLRFERCRVCWWLKSLVLAPPIPPLVELYIHFPQDGVSTQHIPILLGRTLERFAFTDTSMPLDCLVPLLVASERLQWLDLSRTSVDCDMLRRFLNARHVGGKGEIATLIVHGCHHLGMDAFDCTQGCVTTLEVDASTSP